MSVSVINWISVSGANFASMAATASLCAIPSSLLNGSPSGTQFYEGASPSQVFFPLKVSSTASLSAATTSRQTSSSRATPSSRNYSSASSSVFQNPQTRKLNLQRSAQHERDAIKSARRTFQVTATMAPPMAPVSPDTSKGDGETSLGMDEVLNRNGGEERVEETEKTGEAFVWRDHWYPVSLIEDLDPTVPTPFQLLGRELVVWKDQQGEWRVFLDKCPHRLAPLSVSNSLSLALLVLFVSQNIYTVGFLVLLHTWCIHD